MKINRSLIFFGILFLISSVSYAQTRPCNLVEDSLLLITLDIRSSDAYPIIMSGVAKTDIADKLNKSSKDSLIESFYQNADFVPDISNGIGKAVPHCMGDSAGYQYLKEHQVALAKLRGAITRCSSSAKFHLISGETVYYRTIMIKGTFWIMDKNDPAVSTNSMEIPLTDIQSLSKCYVPFEIEIVGNKHGKKK